MADRLLSADPQCFAIVTGDLTIGGAGDVELSADLECSSTISAPLFVTITPEFGFTIYADILDSALAGTGTIKRFTARLRDEDDVELPIKEFTHRAPAGAMGQSLTVGLADPSSSAISGDEVLEFDLGFWNGSAFVYVPILAGGTVQGRDRSLGFDRRPTDQLNFSTADTIGQRWNRAPRTPVILYDPQTTVAPSQSTQNALRDEAGNAILPEIVPFFNLMLRDVLSYAYVTGCGFAAVQTNLLNFPVTRVEFSLEGGFDGGARSLLSLFEPVFFVEGETLWIIDPDEPLPAGVTPQDLPLSSVLAWSDSTPATEPVNALIVSYGERAGDGDTFTTRIETENSERGTFGTPGYTKTEISRTIREYRNTADPDTIVREVVASTETATRDYLLNIISRETQQDQFDSLGRKSGHLRTVESLVPDLENSGALTLLTCASETCSIAYKTNPFNPRQDVQDQVTTYVEGLIHSDEDNTYLDQPFRLPLTDAHRNGFIDPEANQSSLFGPIKTTRERLNVRGNGQLDVEVTVIDHIANTTERTIAAPRTGSSALDRQQINQQRVLIVIPDTEEDGRRVPTLDAGDLPRETALLLGRRKLARLNHPPRTATAQLPFPDLSLRRGKVVQAYDRAGALARFIIVGHTTSGSALGTAQQRIVQALELRELVSA